MSTWIWTDEIKKVERLTNYSYFRIGKKLTELGSHFLTYVEVSTNDFRFYSHVDNESKVRLEND